MAGGSVQTRLQGIADRLVAEGKERGLQAAGYLDGELVVEVAAGFADLEGRVPVTPGTLFPVFSATKGIVSVIAHILVERAQLDYDAALAEIWPEFGRGGKRGITLRHCLAHTAGIPYLPPGIDGPTLRDWRAMVAVIESLAPVAAAGERTIYHVVSFGWIIGEALRRAAGRGIPELLQDEICAPLGIDGLFIGIPAAASLAVAELDCIPEPAPAPPECGKPVAIPNCMLPLHAWMNRSDARAACLPASSGMMTARSVAGVYAALLPGGIGGRNLLPTERVEAATRRQPARRPMPGDPPYALGFELGAGFGPFLGDPRIFGHAGYGGAHAFASVPGRFSFACFRNRISGEKSAELLVGEFLAAVAPRFLDPR